MCISLIIPPFNGPTSFWFYHPRASHLPTLHRIRGNLPDIPFYRILASFIALCWLTMPISPSANGPTGLPFLTILPVLSPIQVYIANFSPPPNDPTGFTIFGPRIYLFYTVNRRTYRLCHFTILPILAPSAGPRRQLYHFTISSPNLAPSAGLRCQLPHRETGLLVYHFYQFYPTGLAFYHFVPILAPAKINIAN